MCITVFSQLYCLRTNFSNSCKENAVVATGNKKLELLGQNLPKPLVAIGGINLNNLESVKKTGVEIISLINGISSAVSPQQAFLKYKERWEE